MAEVYCNRIKAKYLIAVAVMLFFVLNDLVFDFLFSFESSDYISFAFTLASAIIVFYCNYSLKKKKITTEFENAETFIKSNFDNWQVAFSVLDIVCGVISILSGLAFLGAIFKMIKVGYVPIKIAVVSNKSKSIVKAVTKVSLLWTSGRLLSDNGEQNNNKEKTNMFKKIGAAFKTFGLWIYSNKKSLAGTLAGIASGVATGMAVHADIIAFLPEIIVFEFDIMPYLAGLIIFGLTEIGVTGRGFEAIKVFLQKQAEKKAGKDAAKVVKADKKAKAELDKQAKEYLKEQEVAEKAEKKKLAAEKAKQEKEAKKQQEEAAKAEAAKKAEEEKSRIIARAMELKAEAERKAAEKSKQ